MAARRRSYAPRRNYRRSYSRASSGGGAPIGSILALGALVGGGVLAWQNRAALEAWFRDIFGMKKSSGGSTGPQSSYETVRAITAVKPLTAGGVILFPSPLTMGRVPPAGFQPPFGLMLPNGAMYTGKVNTMPPPMGAVDMKTPWYTAEIILANGQHDTLRVMPV